MKKFISCDWGTTNFRLSVVDRNDTDVLAQFTAGQGIAQMHRLYMEQPPGTDRFRFYRDYLQHGLKVLEEQAGFSLTGLPIVVSGMASSAMGMEELPYAVLGEPIQVKTFPEETFFRHRLLLVSGVRSETDIMRGEETKFLGLDLPVSASGCCVLPGTHSKHIFFEEGMMTGFTTYLTGELFALLQQQGILSQSVGKGESVFSDHQQSFAAGVKTAGDGALLHRLFTVRTRQLLQQKSRAENYWYLSGLLIGEELSALQKKRPATWYLCSDGSLGELYRNAAEYLQLDRPVTVSAAAALIAGQNRLLPA